MGESFDQEIQQLIGGGSSEGGISKAEAEVLKELLSEKHPLFKSEIADPEMMPYLSAWGFADMYGLKLYKAVLEKFLMVKVPRKRLRVNEILQAFRRNPEELNAKGSLWQKLTRPRI